MKVYLIRHTAVAVAAGICYGITDVPLADDYMGDFGRLIPTLPKKFTTVFSSPLTRCTQLAAQLHPQFTRDDRLREYNFGDWEMRHWHTIQGDGATAWYADFVNQPAPNGDTYTQMAQRVADFWQAAILPLGESAETIAIVTHAGVIRALLAHILNMPLASSFSLTVDKGSQTLLTCHPQHTQVEYINR